MTQKVQVAIVGGGIVGCSVLYWLAKLGWNDTLLLERRELTSGSTWHAAGNVTYFGHYPSITRLYVNSIQTYLQAERESGQSVGFHETGSLRLATTQREFDAYQGLLPMYEALGIEYRVIGKQEIEALHPLLQTNAIYGAAHTPGDGHVDASGATHALAKSARQMGAQIRKQCPVTGMVKVKNGWLLNTDHADIHAENVVLASSFWTRELAERLGLNLPLYALEHQEVVTGPSPELESLDFEVPTVRDPWGPSNVRQEGSGYLCGVYESSPVFWGTGGIPGDFQEELLPPDINRLETHLLRVMERIPSFGEAGIKAVNNGPICYTPDGCPLLGPVVDYPGLWLASGFCVGIGTGGGSGEYLAKWMTTGTPEYDLPIVYPSRFSNDLTRERCLELIRDTYVQGYVTPR